LPWVHIESDGIDIRWKGCSRQCANQFASTLVEMVVFGQATGAIHVSIVDLILPETPCFPFEAFQVKRFLQTLRTNAFLDLSCDSDRMLDLLSSLLKNSQSSWDSKEVF